MIYRASIAKTDSPLRQGEILTSVVQVKLDVASLQSDPVLIRISHPFAVVLTQDCDLDQDFRANQDAVAHDKKLPSILLGEVATAEELRSSASLKSPQWARAKINKDERFQFLEKVAPPQDAQGVGLPELAIDFKRVFTIPRDEIYRRIEIGEAQRRCVLQSPYVEHLSSRFAYFLSRVALPAEHQSDP